MAITFRGTAISDAALEAAAEAILPHMNDPKTWDTPPPACTAEAHEWAIEHDKQVPWESGPATGISTYPVAIVCQHCDIVFG